MAKRLSDEISEEEDKVFQLWLKTSPEHQKEFQNTIEFCEQAELMAPLDMPNPHEEWLGIKQHIGRKAEIDDKSIREIRLGPHIGRPRVRYSLVVILPIVLLMTLGLVLWKINSNNSPQVKYTTQYGQTVEMMFTDGSHLRLNSGSTIKYPEVFSEKTREIYLSGEAYFDIKKGKSPFVVITDNAKTTVLGTQFNIWARNGKTRVVVKKGHVRLQPIQSDTETVDLVDGKMSEISGESPPQTPKSVDINHQLGWLERKLTFDQTPLSEIVEELERHYAVRITFGNANIGNSTLTGSFENMPVDTVLASICLTLNIKFYNENGEYCLH